MGTRLGGIWTDRKTHLGRGKREKRKKESNNRGRIRESLGCRENSGRQIRRGKSFQDSEGIKSGEGIN